MIVRLRGDNSLCEVDAPIPYMQLRIQRLSLMTDLVFWVVKI